MNPYATYQVPNLRCTLQIQMIICLVEQLHFGQPRKIKRVGMAVQMSGSCPKSVIADMRFWNDEFWSAAPLGSRKIRIGPSLNSERCRKTCVSRTSIGRQGPGAPCQSFHPVAEFPKLSSQEQQGDDVWPCFGPTKRVRETPTETKQPCNFRYVTCLKRDYTFRKGAR